MQPIPDDPALPALVAGRREGFASILARCGLDEPIRSVRTLRHHPGRRCTFEVRLAHRRVALKAFKKDPTELAGHLRRLAQCGLDRAAGPSITVLIGHDPENRCFVTSWLEGETGEDLIANGKGERLSERVAQWAAAAGSVPKGALAPYGVSTMLEDLRRWQASISAVNAELGITAAECIAELAAALPADGTPGLLHGSFAYLHLVDLGEGPGILDWDEPRFGPIELDLGTMLASLMRHALLRPAESKMASIAASQIKQISAYPYSVNWYRRAALVKYAKHMCNLQRPDWKPMARDLLSAARDASL